MPSAAEHIATLERYFATGGDLGPEAQRTRSSFESTFQYAMRALIYDGSTSKAARRAFAQAQIFEKVLSPPSLDPNLYVRPSLQITMFDALHTAATGGFWWSADPSGLTEWLGTGGGAQYSLEVALTDPPRVVGGLSIELPPEAIASMLRVLRDSALPASWFGSFARSDMFQRLEVRTASSAWSTSQRRTVLALLGQVQARISTELARIASAGLTTFPSFATGDGQLAPTPPPPPRPWFRSGWTLVGGLAGVVGGGFAARRRR